MINDTDSYTDAELTARVSDDTLFRVIHQWTESGDPDNTSIGLSLVSIRPIVDAPRITIELEYDWDSTDWVVAWLTGKHFDDKRLVMTDDGRVRDTFHMTVPSMGYVRMVHNFDEPYALMSMQDDSGVEVGITSKMSSDRMCMTIKLNVERYDGDSFRTRLLQEQLRETSKIKTLLTK